LIPVECSRSPKAELLLTPKNVTLAPIRVARAGKCEMAVLRKFDVPVHAFVIPIAHLRKLHFDFDDAVLRVILYTDE
jgi:hypothetical protein